ncbi:MAG TPA: hypothetical protein VGG19_12950 [Tepidisphaeraceae bacterium]|jgi:hypothetical protein
MDSFSSIAIKKTTLPAKSSPLTRYFWVQELFPKAVDGVGSLSASSFTVDEHDAVDQVS